MKLIRTVSIWVVIEKPTFQLGGKKTGLVPAFLGVSYRDKCRFESRLWYRLLWAFLCIISYDTTYFIRHDLFHTTRLILYDTTYFIRHDLFHTTRLISYDTTYFIRHDISYDTTYFIRHDLFHTTRLISYDTTYFIRHDLFHTTRLISYDTSSQHGKTQHTAAAFTHAQHHKLYKPGYDLLCHHCSISLRCWTRLRFLCP
jgi:hypothetical protein